MATTNDTLAADPEATLKLDLLRADIALKRRQSMWETPRNIAILVGTTAAVVGGLVGWAGYNRQTAPQIVFPSTLHVTIEAAPTKPAQQ